MTTQQDISLLFKYSGISPIVRCNFRTENAQINSRHRLILVLSSLITTVAGVMQQLCMEGR